VAACPPGRDCAPMDGRSLRPLLEGEGEWPADRAIPLSLDEGWTYRALRTAEALYAEFDASRWQEFAEPVVELYDLEADPDELENIAGAPDSADRVAELHDRLEQLAVCAGIEGRDAGGEAPTCE
jgi:arylsulfatase A-like enzyme